MDNSLEFDLTESVSKESKIESMLKEMTEKKENRLEKENDQKKTVPFEKSALFSKLQVFLPEMSRQNDILKKEIEAGEVKKYNIEVEDTTSDQQKIEMNFALGVLDNVLLNDGDTSDNTSDEESEQEPEIKIIFPNNKKPSVIPQIQELN